jgi:hypothetical protein
LVKKRSMNDTMTVEEGAVIGTGVVKIVTDPPREGEDPDYNNLLGAVQEIRKRPEIFGYILKGDTKATVDLNDPAKIIEYALLSTQAFESSESLSSTFKLGTTENILVEGKTLKALCIDLGQNKVSIFMEKNTDHIGILNSFEPETE